MKPLTDDVDSKLRDAQQPSVWAQCPAEYLNDLCQNAGTETPPAVNVGLCQTSPDFHPSPSGGIVKLQLTYLE